jgi:hypothetical protein
MKFNNIAIVLAGLLGAGLAQAQSHSVANYSNPPNTQADSKAGTKATPGLSATHARQDIHHGDQNIPSGKLRKAKPIKSKNGGDNASTAKPKAGAESTMQRDPSEADPNKAQEHAFDTTPGKK